MYYNRNYEYKQINSAFIVIDEDYQRELDQNRVKRIVAKFNPVLVNPIKVSYRNGKYYVFDGQHTLAALKMRNGGKDLMVECKIYRGLSEADEAILFSEQNGISRQVATNAKLKALYTAGDIEIKNLLTATEAAGFYINFTYGQAANKIVCVAKAFQVYKKMGQFNYIEILRIIKDSWGGSSDSMRTEILGGLALFCETYMGRYRRKTLVNALSSVNPIVIVRDGKAFGNSLSGDKRFAVQILSHYNKRSRGEKLAAEF